MKLLFSALLLVTALFSKEIVAQYKVSYGFFGKIGVADARLERNETNYSIEIVAKATGFAKVLSGSRVERYTSEGKVVDGKLVPLRFVKSRSRRNKRTDKFFEFDHAAKRVYVYKKYYKNGKFIKKTKPSVLPFYAKDDLLTLYFNIKDELPKRRGALQFHAVGGDRKTGAVDIVIPDEKKREELKRLLKTDGFYIIAIIHQKIFASKNGELFIAMDKDGIAKKALLKDVIMFGDVVGTLVKKRVSE